MGIEDGASKAEKPIVNPSVSDNNSLNIPVVSAEATEVSNNQFMHVFFPAVLGASFGALGQHLLSKGIIDVSNSFSPFLQTVSELLVIVAMALPAILLIGLFHCRKGDSYLDFSGGGIIIFLPVIIFCVMFPACLLPIVIVVWFYISMSWPLHKLPIFRVGMWTGMGSLVGCLVGAMAYTMLA
ncbi:MAG TPA: hypothetical protein EYQ53_02935 [Candidatus Poseidoniales archaeon]|jgi:hypothetical protein|nr:MAG: hypothetical protein CXT69_00665 [Euryarchaeota archaeon]HIG03324.1 hypothetical protein [Candidatus Poseidoniales archaeon]HIK78562.1 hypothetical protein [Candidatus Poseidoniales archaeon]